MGNRGKKRIAAAFFILVLVLPALALAGSDTSPRDTIPAPAGTDVALFYWRAMNGSNYYAHGNKVSDNADFEGNVMIARYLHYSRIGNMPLMLDIFQPFGSLNLEYGPINDRASGLGDTTAHIVLWTPDLIAKADNKFWVGFSFYVTAPTGDYHSEKAVNLGENRWQFKPEVSLWIWRYKRLSTEAVINANFYTDNDDTTARHYEQKKPPVYGLEAHVSYDVIKDFWLGLSYIHLEGGKTELNGVRLDDRTITTTLKFSANMKITQNWSTMIQYVADVEQENGVGKNYFQARLSYAW